MMLLMDRRPLAEPGSSCASAPEWFEQPTSAWASSSGRGATNATHTTRQPGGAAVGLLVPLGALAETYQSDGSRDAEGCFGAETVLTGIGSDSAATFTGIFSAAQRGHAYVLLEQLAAAVKQHALALEEPCAALAAAVNSCQAAVDTCEGLTGCAALASRGSIAYCGFGKCWMALGARDGTGMTALDLLADPTKAEAPEEAAMPLASLMRKDRNAFGSIIPVDRTTALPPGMAAPHQRALMGRRQLEPMYHFLVLGAGSAAEAMSASDAVERIGRLRQHAEYAGKAASTLGKECVGIQGSGQETKPILVAVLHFTLPRLPFDPPQQLDTAAEDTIDSQSLPGQASSFEHTVQPVPAGLPRMLLSPSGRRVHFLPPIFGEDMASPAAHSNEASSPNNPRLDHTSVSSAGSGDSATRQSGGFPDSSSLLSSGSMLSQPNMAIPEEAALPEKHCALQLPPPLLAPIRKAYPSSEIRFITPEMLSSPSPARKAKIGRAASMNSPDGLWPLPPQAEAAAAAETCVRSSTGSVLGSCSRGSGEEGRVRGGLPRIASVPSRLAGSFASSPAASSTSSPRGSFNALLSTDSAELSVPVPTSVFRGLPRSSSAAGPSVAGQTKKTRGQSSALRLLQAGRGGLFDASSAPAGLLRLSDTSGGAEGASSTLDADARTHSSGSETLSIPSAGGSTGSKGSNVRRVPVLAELPTRQVARLSLGRDNSQEGQAVANKAREAPCQVRGPPLIPQVSERGLPRNFSTGSLWPSRPSTSLDLEGRQHSGGAFSGSSLAGSPESPDLSTKLGL